MDRAGKKAPPMSQDELRGIFDSVHQGESQDATWRKVKGRNRTTVVRAHKIAKELELRNPDDRGDDLAKEIALQAGYSISSGYVQYLFLRWRAWKGQQATPQSNISLGPRPDPETEREHRGILMAPLLNLKEIQPLSTQDYDLAVWFSRPDEPSWPVSKGRAWRQREGALEIRLHIEGQPEVT